MFELGKIYRRRDMHNQYGGQEQGGIATPTSMPAVWLFSGASGQQYGYKDAWIDDNTLRYYGEGQYGDMKFLRGNRAIRDYVKNAEQLFLFERLGDGYVRFVGEMVFHSHSVEKGEDRESKPRDVIVFNLKRAI